MIKKHNDIRKSLIDGRKQSLASHIYLIFWDIQEWTMRKWMEDGWLGINSDNIKVIYLLSGVYSLSNSELAKLAGVSKQAMSQMVTTLEKRGLITIKQNPKDSRSKLISLSVYGLEFLSYLGSSTDALMREYTEIIGEEKMRIMTQISLELGNGLGIRNQVNENTSVPENDGKA